QSIADALNNVVAVAKEQKMVEGFFFGGAITPGMIIDGFNFSSKTEFGG
ncbi:TldD/PmbA family protein, partial [bacterium]